MAAAAGPMRPVAVGMHQPLPSWPHRPTSRTSSFGSERGAKLVRARSVTPIRELPSMARAASPFHASMARAPSPPAFARQRSPYPLRQQRHSSPCPSSRREQATKTIAVIAPGAGTNTNGNVFSELGRSPGFSLRLLGQSRAAYDRYPEYWPQGAPAPNLRSFASEVASAAMRADCLVVGSRGGQVVLPKLWQEFGAAVPPAVIINGGCAMKIPETVAWPEKAVTFLLLGGKDHFRSNMSSEQYVANAKQHVHIGNRTTAILFVNEMSHMPQAQLLSAVLPHMLRTCLAWAPLASSTPLRELKALLEALQGSHWTGRLLFTGAPGIWQEVPFGQRNTLLGRRHREVAAMKGGA
eukprot:CAMPEP_0197662612 /NCGR_PEP_ID=MMETSP1338-20131121/54101_1 /TAXON_ID=43686 ORGANISM="Pelagodinium beii, Strain RCC1491" /NCGR_SAMPLE_ID=MMETSP1338 /ASSEMBLY_ACC=CAM_ASM_000754 /LENGTH=352 /DNA_ID=CAMNT_0043240529 /DNA_START=68 /DNA_END=1126 /DNA_ORIENTATION=-